MQTDRITTLIREVLAKMELPAEAVETAEDNGRTLFRVRSRDSHLLIGPRGAHLFALNHLVKKMVSKTDREVEFQIDVNDYQAAAMEHLKTAATIMGERARSFKTAVEFEPMSSYERMILHSFFEGATDLTTESVGTGAARRVVVRYKEPTV